MDEYGDDGTICFTSNDDINLLLNTVVSSVRDFTVNQVQKIQKLAKIGTALSAERNIGRLLEMIVDEARRFTRADGGTLYIMSDDERELHFAIVQNESLETRMGGTAGEITWPSVQLYHEDGSPNHANVSSFSALSGEIVNIADVYHADRFNFEGTRKFDATTGYRSRSMLVVPLRNHENDIIGVLQLLNAQSDGTGEIISFSPECQVMTESLASQAAVALTNNRLIKDLQNLFEAFIKVIATAIDEKSHYTGEHGRRVVELTMMIAEAINASKEGPFTDIHLNDDQMNELRIAAWLHDVGKVAVPEYVMDKSTKLDGIFDRIELVKTRFEVAKRDVEIARLKAGGNHGRLNGEATEESVDYDKELERLQGDLDFLVTVNQGGEFMSDEAVERVESIAGRSWSIDGREVPFLDRNEVENLSIRKGTLLPGERDIISNHALITHKMLSQLPFPKKMKNVPLYASTHHEYLNGSGYPFGLAGDAISLQARILAIADVFEALTARDRPYRKPNTLSAALKILGFMMEDNHIDADILDLFFKEKIYLKYAREELSPDQIDQEER
ncbi:MAG: GAF domain-containing protein [Syntrophales bacterium]|jgi:HD-GYP domain-containing protein (c-di-GMP phosphodiesterase class II)|nr:GAF domain-containing protein [Syntrophales bacterium]MCK9528276.1 GAF domain-containing protein [Syntrophales bacterium]MDX9922408.1 HD domain-containing phosphohydrolase [Syntrophales bacterium]